MVVSDSHDSMVLGYNFLVEIASAMLIVLKAISNKRVQTYLRKETKMGIIFCCCQFGTQMQRLLNVFLHFILLCKFIRHQVSLGVSLEHI